MAVNYTPVDIDKMRGVVHKQNTVDVAVVFLVLILITLAVLAGLLFILIQQRMKALSVAPLYFA